MLSVPRLPGATVRGILGAKAPRPKGNSGEGRDVPGPVVDTVAGYTLCLGFWFPTTLVLTTLLGISREKDTNFRVWSIKPLAPSRSHPSEEIPSRKARTGICVYGRVFFRGPPVVAFLLVFFFVFEKEGSLKKTAHM